MFGNGYNKFQAFRSQLDNFAQAIRGEDKLVITPEDALASVKVIEAAYADLRNSTWQPVLPLNDSVESGALLAGVGAAS